MSGLLKMSWRSIRRSLGRYIALVVIVFLSVGFFSGLKLTTSSMINTGNIYLREQGFYDFRLISTIGLTDSDVAEVGDTDGVRDAEGVYSADILVDYDGGSKAMKLISMPNKVNLPSLKEGRMPEKASEVVVDADHFRSDDIGRELRLSQPCDGVEETVFTVVGLVDSPLYLSATDRGTASIGNGSIFAFMYTTADAFSLPVYTEISVTLDHELDIYTDEYDALIASRKDDMAALIDRLATERYEQLRGEYLAYLSSLGLTEGDLAALPDELREQLGSFDISEPETYVLTRAENSGYISFENDTAIVGGVANVFPIFFIVIALLVCVTTMTRMVDEERTEIGVLKAMGFSDLRIMGKYFIYAASATVIGWLLGFFVCTWALPEIFWFAYGVLYGFTSLRYYFSLPMLLLTLAVSLVAILGATAYCCLRSLRQTPAALIRPRAAKAGKRILLERVTPLWRRLRFLDKITLRNMFRYKQRLAMMLVGIGCCAGLVLTAFGVRDSMINIGSRQYEYIQNYDMELAFDTEDGSLDLGSVEGIDDILVGRSERVDASSGDKLFNNVTLMSYPDTDALGDYWRFEWEGERISYPGRGEVIINDKIAEKLGLFVGDSITLQNTDRTRAELRVSGIYNNHVFSYILISEQTYSDAFGQMKNNSALLKLDGSVNGEALAEELTAMTEVTTVSRIDTARETLDSALNVLNYIIWLVIGFSAALAFVVIFNLTNINIAERSREIATVQVLGFYPRETNAYVLRENLVLSVIASVLGMPLGVLFHRLVMGMVSVDSFMFNMTIAPVSYLLAIVFTIVFAALTNLFMRRRISRIKMAESLKAVE